MTYDTCNAVLSNPRKLRTLLATEGGLCSLQINLASYIAGVQHDTDAASLHTKKLRKVSAESLQTAHKLQPTPVTAVMMLYQQ